MATKRIALPAGLPAFTFAKPEELNPEAVSKVRLGPKPSDYVSMGMEEGAAALAVLVSLLSGMIGGLPVDADTVKRALQAFILDGPKIAYRAKDGAVKAVVDYGSASFPYRKGPALRQVKAAALTGLWIEHTLFIAASLVHASPKVRGWLRDNTAKWNNSEPLAPIADSGLPTASESMAISEYLIAEKAKLTADDDMIRATVLAETEADEGTD